MYQTTILTSVRRASCIVAIEPLQSELSLAKELNANHLGKGLRMNDSFQVGLALVKIKKSVKGGSGTLGENGLGVFRS
ncbi:hypothetical protein [Peribacillus loiseleuriae]|uniref:hypothetical protein n=1 Tax=Peribacillus loiseleuriae TaxID=1679170 RepID=UPI003D038562